MIILKNISRIYVEKHYVRYTVLQFFLVVWSYLLDGATVHRHAFVAYLYKECGCCPYWVEKNMPSPVIFSQSNYVINMKKS